MFRPILREGFFDLSRVMQDLQEGGKTFTPNLNVKENESSFVIEVDLPGLQKDEISVHVENNVLVISGERKVESKEEGENYLRIESRSGTFMRKISISPDRIDTEKIESKFENGVLDVVLPKKEPTEAKKKVEVK